MNGMIDMTNKIIGFQKWPIQTIKMIDFKQNKRNEMAKWTVATD